MPSHDDFAPLSLSDLKRLLFQRPVYTDEEKVGAFNDALTTLDRSNANELIPKVVWILEHSREIAAEYSVRAFFQGLDAIFSPWGMSAERYPFDASIPLGERIAFVRAIVRPYADVLALSSPEEPPRAMYMLWYGISRSASELFSQNLQTSDDCVEETAILDTLFATLQEILALPSWSCQVCALHGLSHLPGARGERIIDSFLQANIENLLPEKVEWINRCREHLIP
jgi:hypothetical protein